MSTFQLTVEIDPNQLELLSKNNYSLCIAKAGSLDSGPPAPSTAIWSRGDMLPVNVFQWQDVYQVFGTIGYLFQTPVESRTQRRTIQFGQNCTIDSAGNMGTAVGPVDPSGNSFSVTNNWKHPMNIGASCALRTPDSTQFIPIDFYVSPSQVTVSQTIKLKPVDCITCWFQGQGEANITSTWITDFGDSNPASQIISYNADGEWQDGPLSAVEESVSVRADTTTTTTTKPESKAGHSAEIATTTTTTAAS